MFDFHGDCLTCDIHALKIFLFLNCCCLADSCQVLHVVYCGLIFKKCHVSYYAKKCHVDY